MESAMFAEVLRKVNVETPITNGFDKDEKYGQKRDRWWDNSTGTQKEHVICWFSRKHYGGSTSECIANNFPSICKQCYFEEQGKKPDVHPEEKNAKTVFKNMKRPEMYIYIVEALGILEKEELTEFVKQIKDAIDNNESWHKVINGEFKEFLWGKVEDKVRSILEEK